MSGLPGDVSGAVGSNNMSAPYAMANLGGEGMPGGSMTHGPSGQSTASMLAGSGIGGLREQHTGPHTSNADPFGQPRIQVNNQYFIDMDQTRAHDVGDLEFTWIDKLSGTPGIYGQNQPYRFLSLSALNLLLKQPEMKAKYGHRKSSQWFNERFAFVGVLRHMNPDKVDSMQGDLCQMFNCGGYSRIIDVFQSAPHRGEVGPDINDDGWMILRCNQREKERYVVGAAPTSEAEGKERYWQMCPYYTKNNDVPRVGLYRNRLARGQAYKVCRVLEIYAGSCGNKGVASNFVYHATQDGSYKAYGLQLRQLDIMLQYT